jgi:tryptophan synthase alpha chain
MTLQNRYQRRFEKILAQQAKAFIPFTLLGWPNIQTSYDILKTMIAANVTALELGLPFSDPIADGATIQQAVTETLATGFSVAQAWELIAQVRALDADIPIGLLVYYNLILARGPEAFFAQAAQAGVDGVLVADLPPEMAEDLYTIAQQVGIALIFIASPLTREDRLQKIARYGNGFLYAVSRLGVTGAHATYDVTLSDALERFRAQVPLPVCVGFGVSTPAQAQHMIAQGADGVITGSRIIELVRTEGVAALTPYLQQMQQAVNTQSVVSTG